jgi:hypothetical protein
MKTEEIIEAIKSKKEVFTISKNIIDSIFGLNKDIYYVSTCVVKEYVVKENTNKALIVYSNGCEFLIDIDALYKSKEDALSEMLCKYTNRYNNLFIEAKKEIETIEKEIENEKRKTNT